MSYNCFHKFSQYLRGGGAKDKCAEGRECGSQTTTVGGDGREGDTTPEREIVLRKISFLPNSRFLTMASLTRKLY